MVYQNDAVVEIDRITLETNTHPHTHPSHTHPSPQKPSKENKKQQLSTIQKPKQNDIASIKYTRHPFKSGLRVAESTFLLRGFKIHSIKSRRYILILFHINLLWLSMHIDDGCVLSQLATVLYET